MRPLVFPGWSEDAAGNEAITWTIRSSDRIGHQGRCGINTRIRGIPLSGLDFDGLEPCDVDASIAQGLLPLDAAGEICECILTGELPCMAQVAEQVVPITMRFELDLHHDTHRPRSAQTNNLKLSIVINGDGHAVIDDWFEDGALRLDQALRRNRLRCCVTCLYSDYSPGGHGLMGIRCHRGAKALYLKVRSKADYWSVPVTAEVPETYLCDQHQLRREGTGYRG